MKTLVVQKAVLLSPDNKVLLLKRSANAVSRPEEWDLPGGKLDAGEDLMTGILREIKEETGIDVAKVTPVYSQTYPEEVKGVVVSIMFTFYVAHTIDTHVRLSSEHTEFKWVPFEQAAEAYDYDLHNQLFMYIQSNNIDI